MCLVLVTTLNECLCIVSTQDEDITEEASLTQVVCILHTPYPPPPHTHTDRQTDTHGQTDTHTTQTDTHRQTDRHTHTHRASLCICPQVCVKGGLDEQTIKKILARSKDQDIKDKLKASTQEAIELGVSHTLHRN